MKKFYLLVFTAILLVFGNNVKAQQLSCGTDDIHNWQMANNPLYRQQAEAQVRKWSEYVAVKNRMQGLINETEEGTIYEIPIVFHIIHTGQEPGTAYNPTDATINQLVAYLNSVYAATATGNPGPGAGGVNVPIRFKLAQRDPDCQPTTGINRVDARSNTAYLNYGIAMSGATNGAPDATIKALSIWPNTDYLNIWIVTNIQGSAANGGGVAGYAYYPGAAANIDGIVLRRDQTTWAIAHEVGHSLGLRHTFQGSSDASTCPTETDCSTGGDLVCDTDPHALVSGCPTGTNPCTGNSYIPVVYNIMNYSSCPNRFTAGQRDRMLFQLINYRGSLLTSLGGYAPGNNPGSVTPPVTACTPASIANPTNTYAIGPQNVSLGTLDFSSDGYSSSLGNFYEDNTVQSCLQVQKVAYININTNYTLSVSTGLNRENVRVWIDYNNNGTFESGELALSSNGTTQYQTHTATVNRNASNTVICTPLRMRVFSDFYGSSAPTVCGNPAYGQVEDYIVIVQEPSNPGISIAANPGNAVCNGANVIFTATGTNGGSSPVYNWYINGAQVGTGTTYATNTLNNGDVVTATITSSSLCATAPATSNAITMQVSTTPAPVVTISANPSGAICAGTEVTFSATTQNTGNNTGYTWYRNNIPVGNASTYTTSALSNADQVYCAVTSDVSCGGSQNATSNVINIAISSQTTPEVSITANPAGEICAGTNVTYTATGINGGTNPNYTWYLNNVIVAMGSNTFQYNSHSTGDVVYCMMESNSACATTGSVRSNDIMAQVSSGIMPEVNVSSNATGTICSGTNLTFTAQILNAGVNPQVEWFKNTTLVSNASSFSTTNYADGDRIYCVLHSNSDCAIASTVTSDTITLTVIPSTAAGVSIAASPSGSVCNGTPVTFSASTSNAGTAPTYKWYRNNILVDTTATYSNSALMNGDIISLRLQSNGECVGHEPVLSNEIVMHVLPTVVPALAVTRNPSGAICEGSVVTFEAIPTNGGNNPTYSWTLNGTAQSSSTSFTSSNLSNGDIVACTMTSSAFCATTPQVVYSTEVEILPNLTPSVQISANPGSSIIVGEEVTFTATVTNGGSNISYQWLLNGIAVPGETNNIYVTSSLTNNDRVSVAVEAQGDCIADNTVYSNNIYVQVSVGIKDAATFDNVNIYPNPNSGTFVINGRVNSNEKINASIVTLLGQSVYAADIQPANLGIKETVNLDKSIANGVYILKLSNGNGSKQFRFVIER